MDLSIIIVNFNVKYFLEQALYSILKSGHNLKIEIIVIDNNSTDGSRKYLTPKFPTVKFIWNNHNPGFATSCNMGLDIASGECILFLNPDTIIPEECFNKCLKFIKSKPKCGALGVKMIDGSGSFLKESKRGFPGASASFFRLSGLTFLFPKSKIISAYYAGHLSRDAVNEIDIVAGAFFMVKRSILNKTGGFDSRFFMYGEDIDLSYRIKLAGFKNYYFPEISIIHFKGESTKKSKTYNNIFYGAMHLFVNKHFKGINNLPMHIAISAGKLLSLLKLRVKTKNYSSFHIKNIAAFGNAGSFGIIEELLNDSTENFNLKYKIEVHSKANGSEISGSLSNKFFDSILFSEGILSFKNIIHYMENNPKKYLYLIHANNSSSIVYSDDKNEKGNFISEKSNHSKFQ